MKHLTDVISHYSAIIIVILMGRVNAMLVWISDFKTACCSKNSAPSEMAMHKLCKYHF